MSTKVQRKMCTIFKRSDEEKSAAQTRKELEETKKQLESATKELKTAKKQLKSLVSDVEEIKKALIKNTEE